MIDRPRLSPAQIALLITALCGPLSADPGALAADYFISTQADFDNYSRATFAPGDNILFERGKTFTGMFAPNTAGAPGNVITISTFGTGPKPVINNNGVLHRHPTRTNETVSAGVFLFNAEYVELRGLEITNNNGGAQDEDLFGIYVLGEDTGKYHNHIYIEDNYVHSVNGAVAGKRRGGIHLHGYSPTTNNTATYNNVRIVNNVVDRVGGVGIGTDVDDLVDAHSFTGTNRPNAITNLYVAHNWIGNTGRNTVIARDSDYAVYEYNTSANSSRHDTGHSFFNFRTLGITWQYNEAYGNVGTGNEHDRGGFDADYSSKDTLIQYNYSHGNDWFLGIMKRPNTNVTVRHNLSVNDRLGAYFYGFETASDLENVHIYNNTHYFHSGISPEAIVLDRTPHETTFNNNLFYAAGSGTMGIDAENGVNVAYDNNAYYNFTPPASDSNALLANPVLLSPGAEPHDVDMQSGRHALAGYRLAPGSPYADAGIAVADNGGQDFWGNPISAGGLDIGASEAGGASGLGPGSTVFTGDLFPAAGDADVIVATPQTNGLFGDDAAVSLTQTFQVDSSFDLKSIVLGYEYDPVSDPSSIVINVELFEIADVGATTVVPGSSVMTLTALAIPDSGGADEAAIILDTPVSLEPRSGTEGYALRITNGGAEGFEWRRSNATSGSVYASGKAYENGVEKFAGERDFVLALSELNLGTPEDGDFDGDGDIDLSDLMLWQRGGSPSPYSPEDLALWRATFGGDGLASEGVITPVPEPCSGLLGLGGACLVTWLESHNSRRPPRRR